MFTAEQIDSMRATVELVFVEACTVERSDGEPVFNSTSGEYTAPTVETYVGPCKIRLAPRVGEDVHVGETEIRRSEFNGHFPADTEVAVDDVVTVTASTTDEALIGQRLRVTDIALGSWQLERIAVLELLTD